MKAISLWQPYASFMRDDLKWNETRSRYTHYRGELAICSAKRCWTPGEFGNQIEELARLMARTWSPLEKIHQKESPVLFPRGYVVCVVELVDCQPTENLKVSPLERTLGNYSAGRFAWITRGCRRLKQPVPVVGHQGFFNLPPDVEAKVNAQL